MVSGEIPESRHGQSGCEIAKRDFKSPSGTETKAILANRVKGSSGFSNVCWRREFGRGNTDQPERDKLRRSAE
jgi:hypothetical protein